MECFYGKRFEARNSTVTRANEDQEAENKFNGVDATPTSTECEEDTSDPNSTYF